jgi:hypothetical protein
MFLPVKLLIKFLRIESALVVLSWVRVLALMMSRLTLTTWRY